LQAEQHEDDAVQAEADDIPRNACLYPRKGLPFFSLPPAMPTKDLPRSVERLERLGAV
jgi:hypothetical protein